MERRDLDYLEKRYEEELGRISALQVQKLSLQAIINGIDDDIRKRTDALRELVDEITDRKAKRA